jgi:NAD(P)H-nitrite reductase large subunit
MRHVIVGGGPAATNALETIRQFDAGPSEITLVSDEPAHSRMALPYWLSGDIPREQTHTADVDYFKRHNVQTRFGVRVDKIDASQRAVTLSDGSELSFDRLLLATGSSPTKPPIPGADLPGVQPLWSLAHTESLLDAVGPIERPRVAMIGAGFIGFIVLNAMFKRGWRLSVVEREAHVLPRMLDETAAGYVQNWLATRQVGVYTGNTVQSISETDDGAKQLQLQNGETLEVDLVIVATGIQPNLDLLAGTGIETDQGILVDPQMQTSVAGIYAAGDVAQGRVLWSDSPAIHAIQPTAVDHGRVAGANMAGQEVNYPGSLLMNVVDVCGLQSASFGRWDDPNAETTTIAHQAGFIYRKLLWRGEQLVGAIFTGQANDLGMLTDVGMVKGILQTQTDLGPWKSYLTDNPFDVRRAYVACGVAQKLASTTLLGRPTEDRKFHFDNRKPGAPVGSAHAVFFAQPK